MHGLQGIPSHSFYRLNANIVPNSQDSRTVNVSGGGTRKRSQRRQRRQRRHRRKTQIQTRNGGKKGKRKANSKKRTNNTRYVNYTGRQIGHQSRNQSGGMSFLPGDGNLLTSAVRNMVENGVATLRGVEYTPSPLPFSDKVNMKHQNL